MAKKIYVSPKIEKFTYIDRRSALYGSRFVSKALLEHVEVLEWMNVGGLKLVTSVRELDGGDEYSCKLILDPLFDLVKGLE